MADDKKGLLSIVSTPIGNLEDMTFRAVRTLEEADLIAAEDTRRTRILLDRYKISKRLESYHAFNEHKKTDMLLRMVLEGRKVAVVTDAGTPCVADPGFLLVREALKQGVEPEVVPGVSSLTYAITACGLPLEKFVFYGFLPVKSGRRGDALREIAAGDRSSVLFESPHRMEKLVREILEFCGPDADTAIIREATKAHEEVMRGKISELAERTKGRSWKGECVVVISKHVRKDSQTD